MLPPLSLLWQSLPDETVGDRNERNLFSSIPLIALKVQMFKNLPAMFSFLCWVIFQSRPFSPWQMWMCGCELVSCVVYVPFFFRLALSSCVLHYAHPCIYCSSTVSCIWMCVYIYAAAESHVASVHYSVWRSCLGAAWQYVHKSSAV